MIALRAGIIKLLTFLSRARLVNSSDSIRSTRHVVSKAIIIVYSRYLNDLLTESISKLIIISYNISRIIRVSILVVRKIF